MHSSCKATKIGDRSSDLPRPFYRVENRCARNWYIERGVRESRTVGDREDATPERKTKWWKSGVGDEARRIGCGARCSKGDSILVFARSPECWSGAKAVSSYGALEIIFWYKDNKGGCHSLRGARGKCAVGQFRGGLVSFG